MCKARSVSFSATCYPTMRIDVGLPFNGWRSRGPGSSASETVIPITIRQTVEGCDKDPAA